MAAGDLSTDDRYSMKTSKRMLSPTTNLQMMKSLPNL
jgi:hypothetical protein